MMKVLCRLVLSFAFVATTSHAFVPPSSLSARGELTRIGGTFTSRMAARGSLSKERDEFFPWQNVDDDVAKIKIDGNVFESQVLGGIKSQGMEIEKAKYYYLRGDDRLISDEHIEKFNPSDNSLTIDPTATYSFETDLYIRFKKVPEEGALLSDILKDVTQCRALLNADALGVNGEDNNNDRNDITFHVDGKDDDRDDGWGLEDVTFKEGEILHMEICYKSRYELMKKKFAQVERPYHHICERYPDELPKAAVICLNGEKGDFISRVKEFATEYKNGMFAESKLLSSEKVPLYFTYVPFLNIYKEFADLKRTMAEVKEDIAEVNRTMATKGDIAAVNGTMATKGDIAAVKGDIAAVKGDIAAVKGDMATKGDIAGALVLIGLYMILMPLGLYRFLMSQ